MARSKQRRTEYTRTYENLRGIELGASGSEISKGRLAYAENMYRDWEGEDGSIIESIPGFRRVTIFDNKKVHSIILQRVGEGEEYLLVHAGEWLYRVNIENRDSYAPRAPITILENRKCAHFTHGGNIYIISYDQIMKIDPDGNKSVVGDENAAPYCPIITLNGEPYEQKNLLSDTVRVRYILSKPDEYSYGTPELCYKIIDREAKTCAVSGIKAGYKGEVYVPAYTKIGHETYRTTEIGDSAFYLASGITAIHISEGIERIGKKSFHGCREAKVISIPNSVSVIDDVAFYACKALTDLYIGSGLYKIGAAQFADSNIAIKVHYALTEEQFLMIEGWEETANYEKVWSDPYDRCTLKFPLPENCLSVISVDENGESREFGTLGGTDPTSVLISSASTWETPHEITVTARLREEKYAFGQNSEEYTGPEMIKGCTVAEVFDNRVFLSGNPKLPNTVFYSSIERSGQENPLYFGSLNYFTDGIGGYPVSSMLSVGDSLAVFKSGDDGSGSIFYHTPADTENDYVPRIYPRSYTHSGICCVGASTSFMDDPVFLTSRGLYALDRQDITNERSVVCRSHNVNYYLQKEDLSKASITEWCGYLVILCGDRAYLADSRSTFRHSTGNIEYDWFMLKGIGHHDNGGKVWRFDSLEKDDISAYPKQREIYYGPAMISGSVDTATVFGRVDGKKYSIYHAGEILGGTFYPATVALGVGNLLFFGTEGGGLMVFNNDKRGVPPPEIRKAPDFNAEEYAETMGSRIHPLFYAFDDHAVRYAIKTAYDDCGIPHLTKSTVKNSLVLRCRSASEATIRFEVGTESSDYAELTSFPGGKLSFAEMDLGMLSFSPADYNTLPISEKEKRWIEKQITVYSDGYASPIGISAIAYRYTVEGRVKRS